MALLLPASNPIPAHNSHSSHHRAIQPRPSSSATWAGHCTIPIGLLIEQSDFSKNILKVFPSGSNPDSIMCWR
jgi:hypothetical protein